MEHSETNQGARLVHPNYEPDAVVVLTPAQAEAMRASLEKGEAEFERGEFVTFENGMLLAGLRAHRRVQE